MACQSAAGLLLPKFISVCGAVSLCRSPLEDLSDDGRSPDTWLIFGERAFEPRFAVECCDEHSELRDSSVCLLSELVAFKLSSLPGACRPGRKVSS